MGCREDIAPPFGRKHRHKPENTRVLFGIKTSRYNRGLTSLKILYLRYMHTLTLLPCSIGDLKNLKEIRLCSNKIKRLLTAIGRLSGLEAFHLSFMPEITSLPSSICNLTSLKRISLCDNNKIRGLPDDIGRLTSLEILEISSLKIKSLRCSIGNLSNLKQLRLKRMKLRSLSDSIGRLTSLETLDLSYLILTSLPFSFCNPTNILIILLGLVP